MASVLSKWVKAILASGDEQFVKLAYDICTVL